MSQKKYSKISNERIVAPSCNVCITSANLTARYYIANRERFCGDVMSLATVKLILIDDIPLCFSSHIKTNSLLVKNTTML